ncbi:hypothetical protein PR048_002171 [Dryococelus australis]|uniref:Uncharacterized protein n=1 Tax=Dryococelus australis TaxID=614101 RepID=A0ABQ9IJF2_9NEOP|nr:hypothetical protein PR048_002171 [Dryococelus australis]
MKGRRKREIPEKTRRTTASSARFPLSKIRRVFHVVMFLESCVLKRFLSDETLGVRVTVARIAPSLLHLGLLSSNCILPPCVKAHFSADLTTVIHASGCSQSGTGVPNVVFFPFGAFSFGSKTVRPVAHTPDFARPISDGKTRIFSNAMCFMHFCTPSGLIEPLHRVRNEMKISGRVLFSMTPVDIKRVKGAGQHVYNSPLRSLRSRNWSERARCLAGPLHANLLDIDSKPRSSLTRCTRLAFRCEWPVLEMFSTRARDFSWQLLFNRGTIWLARKRLVKEEANSPDFIPRSGVTVAERLAGLPPTKAIRVHSPAWSLRIFACMNRAVGRRVFSWISRSPHPFIPVPLHTHVNHPHRLSKPRPAWENENERWGSRDGINLASPCPATIVTAERRFSCLLASTKYKDIWQREYENSARNCQITAGRIMRPRRHDIGEPFSPRRQLGKTFQTAKRITTCRRRSPSTNQPWHHANWEISNQNITAMSATSSSHFADTLRVIAHSALKGHSFLAAEAVRVSQLITLKPPGEQLDCQQASEDSDALQQTKYSKQR